jgi:hypothetical protein
MAELVMAERSFGSRANRFVDGPMPLRAWYLWFRHKGKSADVGSSLRWRLQPQTNCVTRPSIPRPILDATNALMKSRASGRACPAWDGTVESSLEWIVIESTLSLGDQMLDGDVAGLSWWAVRP